MNLAVCEWRKLFRLPALWAFLALCLAFNGLLIATLSPYDRAFFNETSQTAKVLGQRMNEDFLAGLDAVHCGVASGSAHRPAQWKRRKLERPLRRV